MSPSALRRRVRGVGRWARLPIDWAGMAFWLTVHVARQWQDDRRTAYRFEPLTPGDLRRHRRAKRRAEKRARWRSWGQGHEHPER